MQKMLLSWATYVVLTFALAMLWNRVLFRESYLALTLGASREQPIVQLGLVSVLLEGIALSLLFHLYLRSELTLQRSVGFCLLVGVFSMTYASFTVPAKFVIAPIWQYLTLELIFGLIHYGLAGLALYLVFRRTAATDQQKSRTD